jgi:hypothetical protein
MENRINKLEINNFKSIRHLELDCKRINVFIGEPNVGKSNILEALCLFTVPFSARPKLLLKDYIRYEKLSNLLYDQDRKNIVTVNTNLISALFRYKANPQNSYTLAIGPSKEFLEFLKEENYDLRLISEKFYKNRGDKNNSGRSFFTEVQDAQSGFSSGSTEIYGSLVKRYIFNSDLDSHPNNSYNNNDPVLNFNQFLLPPDGENLFTILESNPGLYEECSHLFLKYGLDLLIDTETNKLDVQKRIGNRVYKIPYSLAADTLQRIIFHFAAIETNENSILIFEEPEAHSFPKYISMFADKVIESKNNQFFIATHSPYLLTPFIEQCDPKDIAIFICTYENYETKARALTSTEIGNIMETGIDMFYNIPAFEK